MEKIHIDSNSLKDECKKDGFIYIKVQNAPRFLNMA